jgi:hypothetical protein
MRIKMFAATALVALTGAFGATTVAQADERTPTKVTIKGDEGDYYGYVKSSDYDCENDRTVKVYKMEGSSPSPKTDLVIGTDTSSPNGPDGMWSIGNSGYKEGSFYAKVKKTDTCGGDTSKVIVR